MMKFIGNLFVGYVLSIYIATGVIIAYNFPKIKNMKEEDRVKFVKYTILSPIFFTHEVTGEVIEYFEFKEENEYE